LCACLSLVILDAACSRAQTQGNDAVASRHNTAADVVGRWSGSWQGIGSGGGFELMLEQQKNSEMTGRVSVTGGPTYHARLKAVSFDQRKMTAMYDFPDDPQIEMVLGAAFEGKEVRGTWVAREGGKELASGTFQVTKQRKL
jgi:hypothetical protein